MRQSLHAPESVTALCSALSLHLHLNLKATGTHDGFIILNNSPFKCSKMLIWFKDIYWMYHIDSYSIGLSNSVEQLESSTVMGTKRKLLWAMVAANVPMCSNWIEWSITPRTNCFFQQCQQWRSVIQFRARSTLHCRKVARKCCYKACQMCTSLSV